MTRGRRLLATALLCCLLPAGCAARAPKGSPAPIDFAFEIGGEQHRLAELRGRPVALVLMRTSEIPSQIFMADLKEAFAKRAGKTRFLVLTVEPLEKPFVAPYVEAEKLPFPVGVAEPDVALGRSSLGVVPVVPCSYFIGSQGELVSAAAGAIPAREIEQRIEQLDRRY